MLSTSLQTTSNRIAQYYQTSESFLGTALKKIASGKRMERPADDIVDYFMADKLRQDSGRYGRILTDLGEAGGMLRVAEAAGASIFGDLNRMREVVDQYWNPDATDDEKSFLSAEFDSLAAHVNKTRDETYFNDKNVVSSGVNLASIMLDPNDINQKLDIQFDASLIVDASALDVTGPDQATVAAAVQAELDKSGRYLGQVSGFIAAVSSHSNIAERQRLTYNQMESEISDTDTAQEMSKALVWQIRQQTSVSMWAQANMANQNILSLFD